MEVIELLVESLAMFIIIGCVLFMGWSLFGSPYIFSEYMFLFGMLSILAVYLIKVYRK